MQELSKLRGFYCYKILPLVYDDSLSYMELLSKVIQKINEVIDTVNNISVDILNQAKAYTDEAIANALSEVDTKINELNQMIEDNREYFENLIETTTENFNNIVNDLQRQYYQFTTYVNGELTDVRNDIADTNQRLDDSIIAVNARTDLMIALNNDYLLDEFENHLPEKQKVNNALEGEKYTVQDMFDYLCHLHITDGINVTTLASRELTVNRIVDINRSVKDCVIYGNEILVPAP